MSNIENPVKSWAHLRCLPVPFQALVEHNLSPTQWILMLMMHYKLWDEYNAYMSAPTAPQCFHEDELNNLHERKYILFRPVPGDHPKTSILNLQLSERFSNLLYTLKPTWSPK